MAITKKSLMDNSSAASTEKGSKSPSLTAATKLTAAKVIAPRVAAPQQSTGLVSPQVAGVCVPPRPFQPVDSRPTGPAMQVASPSTSQALISRATSAASSTTEAVASLTLRDQQPSTSSSKSDHGE